MTQEVGSQSPGFGEQAREVAGETAHQARNLMNEGRDQVRGQARAGQQKAADGLMAIADELRGMADKSDQSGMATELARQGAQRAQDLAGWLQNRQPGELLDELRSWARRRPGAFLLGAAAAGMVAGRLTGGAMAARKDSAGDRSAADLRTTGFPTVEPAPVEPMPVGVGDEVPYASPGLYGEGEVGPEYGGGTGGRVPR